MGLALGEEVWGAQGRRGWFCLGLGTLFWHEAGAWGPGWLFWRIARFHDQPGQGVDQSAERLGQAGLQQQRQLLLGAAVSVHMSDGLEGALSAEGAAGADAAKQLVKIPFCPTGKQFGPLGDQFGHRWVALPVHRATVSCGGRQEQLVGGDGQALGQPLHRAPVGPRSAGQQGADGPPIQAAASRKFRGRHPLPGHPTPQILTHPLAHHVAPWAVSSKGFWTTHIGTYWRASLAQMPEEVALGKRKRFYTYV